MRKLQLPTCESVKQSRSQKARRNVKQKPIPSSSDLLPGIDGSGASPARSCAILLGALAAAFFLSPVTGAVAATVNVDIIAGTPSASGKVVGGPTGDPDAIECSGPPPIGSCSASVAFGTLTVTATANPGSAFDEWTTGHCAGSGNPVCANFFADFDTHVWTAKFDEAATPPTVTIDDVLEQDVTGTTVAFHGTVDPEGDPLTACRFEYVREADPQGFTSPQSGQAPCDPDAATLDPDGGPQSVTGSATDLQPNTTYRVRLFAAKDGADPGIDEASHFTTLAVSPDPTTSQAWSISDTTATLTGELSARNSAIVVCEFQLVSQASFEVSGFDFPQIVPCAFEAVGGDVTTDLGDFPVDDARHEIAANATGLAPSTAYVFRLTASNGVPLDPGCVANCNVLAVGDTESFETRPPVVFPQRGYELVSAFDTNGVPVSPDVEDVTGEHFAYSTGILPAPGSETGFFGYFRSVRQADGSWTQRYAGRPFPAAGAGIYSGPSVARAMPLFSTNDLSFAAWSVPDGIVSDDRNDARDVYRKSVNDGSIAWLSCTPPLPLRACPPIEPSTEAAGDADHIQHVSAEGDRVLFASSRRLLPEDVATGSSQSLYEWDRGRLSLVGIRPGSDEGFPGGSLLGFSPPAVDEFTRARLSTHNAVSRDGGRVAFQSEGRVYVRLDGAYTVEASDGTDAIYAGADIEMERIFYTREGDLFAYDVGTDSRVNLTPGDGPVVNVLSVSDDGSRVYFAANGVLADGGSPGDCAVGLIKANGACNLYLAELDDADGPVEMTFIAHGAIAIGNAPFRSGSGGHVPDPKFRQVAASADGSTLAFRSGTPLVPGRQTGSEFQVYVYEAERGTLDCASCPPDGSVPAAPASLTPARPTLFPSADFAPFGSEESNSLGPHARNVTANGTAVFFQTASSLSNADSNGRIDTYEYRGGKLQLITGGTASGHSSFAGASANGATVFFASSGAFVPSVKAGILRIYAAVEGGGFEPPLSAPPCTGEDCKPVAAQQPNYAAPATSTVFGRGNVSESPEPRRCGEGKRKVRRNGKARCVAMKHKRARRAHNRAGANRRMSR
jgi:hypothetical protein